MKKLYTVLMMVMLSAGALSAQVFPHAEAAFSGLQIQFPAGTLQYTVMLNGANYQVQHRVFVLDQLQAGHYNLQVGYWSGLGQMAQWVPVFRGAIQLRPGMRSLAVLNSRGHFQMRGFEPIIAPFYPQVPFPHQPPLGHQPPFGHQFPQHPGGSFPGQGFAWAAPMSQQQFQLLLGSIRNRAFDNDRLLIAQQGIRFHGVSAMQVRMLMDEFSFESTRLNFAKLAFDSCVDPHNYFLVNDSFRFSSSVRSLEQHIITRR